MKKAFSSSVNMSSAMLGSMFVGSRRSFKAHQTLSSLPAALAQRVLIFSAGFVDRCLKFVGLSLTFSPHLGNLHPDAGALFLQLRNARFYRSSMLVQLLRPNPAPFGCVAAGALLAASPGSPCPLPCAPSPSSTCPPRPDVRQRCRGRA
ncbi:hypothetical protein K7W03_24705 [Sphingobium sp. PNB]|uniref:hypothetical protein n=1 Tax=Sphingobium sp. PNB TaxID=863934 RepID=UPI001CA3E42C|nr:hypothetical protein [Sphingobium sp. PNB]MCB4862791.1 hypothetical protein [Sphingobium sp. PNB]